MNKLFSTVALAAILTTNVAFADDTFTIASDSSSGTYDDALKEVVGKCSVDGGLNVTKVPNHGGALGNYNALHDNQANAAFMHHDVYLMSAASDVSAARFQVLIPLWYEPIQVVMLRESKITKSSTQTVAKTVMGHEVPGMSKTVDVQTPVDFATFQDAKGFPVGAAGGTVLTLKNINGIAQAGFNIMAYNDGKAVMAALDSGEIAAAVFVGAAPLPNVKNLDPNIYKVVPMGGDLMGRLNGAYHEVAVSYSGLTNGPIKTVGPQAVLMSRKFSPEKTAIQVKFKSCLYANLGKLQDDGLPVWQDVAVDAPAPIGLTLLDIPKVPLQASKK